MKKGRVFMSVVIVISLLFIGNTGALAGGFSFVNISWDDTPEQVFEKMSKSGLCSEFSKLKYYYGKECDNTFSTLLYHRMIDQKMYKSLGDRTRLNSDQIRKLGPINQLRDMEIDGKNDSIVKKAVFFFTCDHKLLSYALDLRTAFSGDEIETGEGNFYRSIVEKYGSPSSTLKHAKKWTDNGQSLYYFYVNTTDVACLLYLSNKNIEEQIAKIKKIKGEFEKKESSKESGVIKKMF